VLDNIVERGTETEVSIFVNQKQPNGGLMKLSSTELCSSLNHPNVKYQLGQMGVTEIAEKTEISRAMLEQYLANPPNGVDTLIWEQAKLDNPDPNKFCPVPLNGFEDLSRRLKQQQNQQDRQIACLEKMSNESQELEKKCIATKARIDEFKRKQQELAHRVLKVMVSQEVHRKMGLGIQGDEERLKVSLEELVAEIESQTRGKMNELQANIKSVPLNPNSSQNNQEALNIQTQIDEPLSEELSQLLTQQQKGIAGLMKILREDMKALDGIQKAFSTSNL